MWAGAADRPICFQRVRWLQCHMVTCYCNVTQSESPEELLLLVLQRRYLMEQRGWYYVIPFKLDMI